ncbi:MAG: PilZ domain-containing protein [bacterium]
MSPLPSSPSLAEKDKRNHPRIPCRLTVKLRNMDADNPPRAGDSPRPRTFPCALSDISLGGAFLEFSEGLKEGKLYHLEVEMPKPYVHWAAFIEVKWTNTRGGGIQFLAIQEERLKDLKSFIESQPS